MLDHIVKGLVESLTFSMIGIIVFGIAFRIIVKVCPFSMKKEIEEDQNVALGIIIGSVIIGLSIIIAVAIH